MVAWLHRDPDAPTDMVEIVSAAATLAATRAPWRLLEHLGLEAVSAQNTGLVDLWRD